MRPLRLELCDHNESSGPRPQNCATLTRILATHPRANLEPKRQCCVSPLPPLAAFHFVVVRPALRGTTRASVATKRWKRRPERHPAGELFQVAPKSANLRHHRAESPFSTSSWTDAGGSEISEFAPSPSGITVFELGGCEKAGSEISEFVSSPSEISVFELGGHREPAVVAPASTEMRVFEPPQSTAGRCRSWSWYRNLRIDDCISF